MQAKNFERFGLRTFTGSQYKRNPSEGLRNEKLDTFPLQPPNSVNETSPPKGILIKSKLKTEANSPSN
jgi:hypothetical protein